MYKSSWQSNSKSRDITANYGWWIEIYTIEPICIYYFGDFDSIREAATAKSGFVEDLEQEGSFPISSCIKLCKPLKVTVHKDELDARYFKDMPVYYESLKPIEVS